MENRPDPIVIWHVLQISTLCSWKNNLCRAKITDAEVYTIAL